MAWSKVISACSVLLALCLTQSQSQLVPQVQLAPFQQSQAASLAKAPVGLYSRSGPFGDQESAASLSGTPVGLFSRRNSAPQFVNFPAFFPQAFFNPYAFLPSAFDERRFAPPFRPRPPGPRPPPRPPVRPPTRPRPPVKRPGPPKRPPVRPRAGLLSSVLG